MTPVEYYKEYKGEEPFEMNGQKYVYCWGVYPGGKKDIAVYSYSNDLAYDYNDFRAANNLSEGYKQPQMFMDINEENVDINPVTPVVTTEEFQDDPTIGELISQSRQDVGAETDAMIAQHDAETAGADAVAGQYDLAEEAQAPEAKEFLGTEKVQTVNGENGLAGKVETGDGGKIPADKEIASLLDRMKELTKIMTNKPDIQWEDRGDGITDDPKEVSPDEVVRSEKATGAPSIKSEVPELRPDSPKQSAPKAETSGDSKPAAEKTEKKGNPFAKKDEKPAEEKKEDDDKENVDEAMSHHVGMERRDITHNENDPNRVEEGEEDEVSEDCAEMNDDEILESENTELMYEAMIKYKNDPAKFIKFKKKIDEISKERRLSEAVAKMRNRF